MGQRLGFSPVLAFYFCRDLGFSTPILMPSRALSQKKNHQNIVCPDSNPDVFRKLGRWSHQSSPVGCSDTICNVMVVSYLVVSNQPIKKISVKAALFIYLFFLHKTKCAYMQKNETTSWFETALIESVRWRFFAFAGGAGRGGICTDTGGVVCFLL